MRRHGRKIGDTASQRILELGNADGPDDWSSADRLRPHQGMDMRHGRTSCEVRSRGRGANGNHWSRRAATRVETTPRAGTLFEAFCKILDLKDPGRTALIPAPPSQRCEHKCPAN